MKRAGIFLFCLAAGLLAMYASTAGAGYKQTELVYVSQTTRVAYGSVGDARASSDSKQYIDCYVIYNNGAPFAACEAQSSAGVFGICHFKAAQTATALQMIATQTTASSYYFTWDADGICTYLNIANGSFSTPMVP
jgi:hypothetical protein